MEISNKGTYFEWLYLLMARGLQWVVLDFVLPFCNLPHLRVYLQKKKQRIKKQLLVCLHGVNKPHYRMVIEG